MDKASREAVYERFTEPVEPMSTRFGSLVSGFTRCDWSSRYATAMALPERTDADIVAKYSELLSTATDFLSLATAHAMQVVEQRGAGVSSEFAVQSTHSTPWQPYPCHSAPSYQPFNVPPPSRTACQWRLGSAPVVRAPRSCSLCPTCGSG